MSTTYADIRTAIEPHVASEWGETTEIGWPNAPFTPPEDEAWIQIAILPGAATAATLGVSGNNLVTGLVHVNIFVPKAAGSAEAWELVDQVRDMFNRRIIGNIRFRVPYPTLALTDGDWMQIPVLCPFVVYE
ncbi:MAG: hypothetical protein HY788_08545 [Deltaproteobacteria bacterium]|nr:hypothetical protein [Deltaproteobacteria bacterium]